jgi:hypothetical protein
MAALNLITTSCGSSGSTQMRIVNTLSNDGTPYPGLDVYVNSSLINGTTLGYGASGAAYPAPATPAKYAGVKSGSDSIGIYNSPTTNPPTNPIFSVTENITSGDQYTLVLAGSVGNTVKPPTAFLFQDNPPTTTTNNVYFRIINASTYLSRLYDPAGGLNVYILPAGSGIGGNPTISKLTYGSTGSADYADVSFDPSAQTEYTVYVAQPGSTQPLISQSFNLTDQEITTLVIYDLENASYFSASMLNYTDLN